MPVDLTDYLFFGSVNIVRDMMCDCMSTKKEEIKKS